jgi:hypothetical protein
MIPDRADRPWSYARSATADCFIETSPGELEPPSEAGRSARPPDGSDLLDTSPGVSVVGSPLRTGHPLS